MPRVSLVGDGHGGSEDYSTLSLWAAAEFGVDYGSQIEASCLGDCGTGATLSGTTVNGALIYTQGIQGDGTNSALLAEIARLTLSNTSPITINDMSITTNNQFVSALTLQSNFVTSNRCVISNTSGAGNTFNISGLFPNSNFNNFIVIGGLNAVRTGFNQGTNLTKGVVFGAANDGVEGSTSLGLVVTDVFSFNNVLEDYESAASFTLVNCASEDSTGTSGLTGYTSTELVDFAGGDYRTKATSFLATAGTGGTFIGAFLEASSGLTVTAESQGYDVNFYDGAVGLTGEIVVISDSQAHNVTFYDATIDLTGEVLVNAGTQNYQVQFFDAQVGLSGGIEVQAQAQGYDVTFFDASIQLSGDINISAEGQAYRVTFYDASVSITELWTDKVKATTNWTDQAKTATIWTDK